MKKFLLVLSCLFSGVALADTSASSMLNDVFGEPVKERPIKHFDAPPYFNKTGLNDLIKAIQANYPNAKKDKNSSMYSSTTYLVLEKYNGVKIQHSEDRLTSLEFYSSRNKVNIKKTSSVICSVVKNYPDCTDAITKMWDELKGRTGLVKLRCGDLKIELVTYDKAEYGHRFKVESASYRDKRYSSICY